MELEKQARIVDDIRDELASRIETRLKIRANMGRSKIVEAEGVLKQAHPSLFIVEVDRKRGRTARQSYQYVDVLTGMVELFDAATGEPLFGAFLDDQGGEPMPVDLLDDDSEDEDDDF